jgi:hypothetical protein
MQYFPFVGVTFDISYSVRICMLLNALLAHLSPLFYLVNLVMLFSLEKPI